MTSNKYGKYRKGHWLSNSPDAYTGSPESSAYSSYEWSGYKNDRGHSQGWRRKTGTFDRYSKTNKISDPSISQGFTISRSKPPVKVKIILREQWYGKGSGWELRKSWHDWWKSSKTYYFI